MREILSGVHPELSGVLLAVAREVRVTAQTLVRIVRRLAVSADVEDAVIRRSGEEREAVFDHAEAAGRLGRAVLLVLDLDFDLGYAVLHGGSVKRGVGTHI